MNIDINLIPAELRAQPLVKPRTLIVVLLVIVLAAGAFYFYMQKSDSEANASDLQASITDLNKERNSVTTNPDATRLMNQINALKVVDQHHRAFLASRVTWGDIFTRVRSYVPKSVMVGSLTQKGPNLLEIKGTAPDYSLVADYLKLLDKDPALSQAGVPPSWVAPEFTILLSVSAGGGA